MRVTSTRLQGVLLLEPIAHQDERGFLIESFSQRAFQEATGIDTVFVQDNHVSSRLGVLRGLHYQAPPHAQGKLVRVVRGSAFDVVVDLRRSSPTLGRWSSTTLDARHRRQVWIPAGFAHGSLALEEGTEVLYKAADFYAPECERSIVWNDAGLGIRWPDVGRPPLLSAKDQAAGPFSAAELF